MPTEYCHHRRVQFYETDAAGIVHFSWFFRYMEEAEHALWRESGLSIEAPGAEIGWPRVSASFDFQRPLRFEDEFDVLIRVAEVRHRTIRYTCTLRKGEAEIGSGTLVTVCVSRRPNEPMKAIAIPPDVVARLRGGLGVDA